MLQKDKNDDNLAGIEEELVACLREGSIRLLRVQWLLTQPAGFRIKRRQEMPEEAFVSPDEAVVMLNEKQVACTSSTHTTSNRAFAHHSVCMFR